MKREIRDRRNALRETSKRLRELAWNCDFSEEKNFRLRERQDEEYKRFKFYDSMIKANEKVNRG